MVDPVLILAIGALAMSCYFASCILALRNYSKGKLLELLEQRGQSERLAWLVERTPQLMLMGGTIRSSMNMGLILAVYYLLDHDAAMYPWLRYLVTFIISGMIVAIFGVAIPQSLARYHPEALLAQSLNVLRLCFLFFKPVITVLHLTDPLVRRLVGADTPDLADRDDKLAEEILSVVEDHADQTGADNEERMDMLEGVIELRSTTAGQIMTPRTEVHGLEVHAGLMEIRNAILEHGHSRFPVFETTIDNVVGMLYVKDLLQFIGDETEFKLRSILREAFMVPESKLVADLLTDFKARKVHIAIVLDEYGGTAGLVTIEDILEEIVGDIQDEYEPSEEKPTIRRLDEKVVEVDARVHVDDLNDEMSLHLPEDQDYDTVGGFVFASLGHIPEVGETFDYENLRLTVLDVNRTKVNRVRLEIRDVEQAHESNKVSDNHHG